MERIFLISGKIWIVVFTVVFTLAGNGIFAQNQAIYNASSPDSIFYDKANLTTPPPTPTDMSWDAITGADSILTISVNDETRYETKRTTDRDQYDFQLFRFKITQTVISITQLIPKWIGYGENVSNYESYLYIWSFNANAWVSLDQQQVGLPDGTLTQTISTNISYYIDGSGFLYLAVGAKHYNYIPSVPEQTLPESDYAYSAGTTSTTVQWNAATDLDGDTVYYQAQYGTTNPPSTTSAWTTSLSTNIVGLTNGNTYYWQVRASDDAGATYTSWSEVRGFSVQSSSTGLIQKNSPEIELVLNSVETEQKNKIVRSLNTNHCEVAVTYSGGPFTPSVPQLITPEFTAEGSSLLPTLRWNASSGTTPITYQVQLGTINDFSGSIVIDQSGLSATYYTLTTALSLDTRYYWRVLATNGTPSAWSEVWYLNTGAIPGIITPATPVTDSVDTTTTPTITWSLPASGTSPFTYNLQVDTTDFFTAPIDLTGITEEEYTFSIDNKLTGGLKYYWRVKAINPFGEGSWSTTFNFTTFQAPTKPVLELPAESAFDQSLTPTFSWEASSGTAPITYSIQVDTVLSFTNPYSSSNLSDTSYTIPDTSALLENTIYFWRVMSINNLDVSAWSDYRTFKTGVTPSKTSLLSPVDGSAGLSDSTLTWKKPTTGSPTLTYEVQVDSDVTFAFPKTIQTTDETFTPTGLEPFVIYYWRVRAINSFGTGTWSNTKSFSLMDTSTGEVTPPLSPTTPALSSPTNGTLDIDTASMSLDWTASSGDGTVSYLLQLDDNSDFSSIILDLTGIGTNSYTLTNLSSNHTYYWRIKASSEYGTSAWTTIWSFTTEMPGDTGTTPPPVDTTTGGVPLDQTGSGGAACFIRKIMKNAK